MQAHLSGITLSIPRKHTPLAGTTHGLRPTTRFHIALSAPHLYRQNTTEMTVDLQDLDAHAQPSNELRAAWKAYSRTDHGEFVNHPDIDDIHVPESAAEFQQSGVIPSAQIRSAIRQLEGSDSVSPSDQILEDAPVYFHPLLPGV